METASKENDLQESKCDWTPRVERELESRIVECEQLSRLHKQASLANRKLHQLFAGLALFFSPLGGVFSSVGGTLNKDSPVLFPILATLAAFIATLLITCVKTAKWQDLQIKHRNTAIRFHNLGHQLQTELSFNIQERKRADYFIRLANETFYNIQSAAPVVEMRIDSPKQFEHRDASTETSRVDTEREVQLTVLPLKNDFTYELERLELGLKN